MQYVVYILYFRFKSISATQQLKKAHIFFKRGIINLDIYEAPFIWKAKLTETQIFRELSIEIESSLF